ncbi:MAG: glycerophosphodiester phosphodiesterase family protein, partial [Clostridia bacterium]
DVQFTDSKTVSGKDITWKNGDKAITSFTPSAKGVTKLTASSGSDSKSIYVVAKDKSDKNYVLYYNDFSSADSIADWKKDSGKESFISVSDGKLVIDAVNSDLTRILLPEWLGEFGNYRIDISEMMSECRDASRWSSIAYRIQNNTYPYYHMCIRKNFAAGSGIEFAIRNTSNAWEVLSTGSYTENQTDGKYYKCSVSTKNDTIMHSVNDTDIVFVKLDKGYMQGRIAIQANYCKLNIDEITVSLQLETPKKDVGPTVIDTTATVENISNALTNVAYINKESDLTSLSSSAMSAILTVGGDNIVDDKGAKLFALSDTFEKIGNSIIPIFRVNSKADADKAIAFLTSKNTFDAAILSSDPEIVKYARNKSVNLRGIIDFTEKYNKPLTNEQMAEIRLAVNGSKSKTALLDISCLTKPVVAELQALLLTVWASDSDLKNTAEAACLIISGAHGVVTNKPATVKESYSFFKKNTLTRTPLIIGHRGNPTNAPDNSISSYLKAVENGANVVETDIYITKDNEVIILHDGTLDRTTNGTGHVENMTLAEIKKFFLWGDNDKYKNQFPNEKVPTLREMFEALKDKDTKIFIEVKGGQKLLIDKMVALIKELNYQSKVCVISFNIDQLVYLQTLMPEISCGYLLSNLGYAADDESANAELYKQLLLIQPKNTTYNVSANNQSK